MTDLRKAAEMALEFAEFMYGRWPFDTTEGQMAKRMSEALRQALAQPEQKQYITKVLANGTFITEPLPLYAAPPKQPEQEPVAWVLYYNNEHGTPMRETFYAEAHMEFHKSHNETQRGLKCQVVPLYTAPPKRELVGLTKEDMPDGDNPMFDTNEFYAGMAWAQTKLKEKNA